MSNKVEKIDEGQTSGHGVKSCFVIGPIGKDDSETRKRSDQILKHIIKKALEPMSFVVTRADTISEPGLITTQVIKSILEADLVVADLTEKNPNVFYELSLRHALRTPCIHILQAGEEIPFDISQNRAIFFRLDDPDCVAQAVEDLSTQAESAMKSPEKQDNPIATAVELQAIRSSGEPGAQSYAEILDGIIEIKKLLFEQSRGTTKNSPMFNPRAVRDLINTTSELKVEIKALQNLEVISKEQAADINDHLERLFDISEYFARKLDLPSNLVHEARFIP